MSGAADQRFSAPIPFNVPSVTQSDIQRVSEALRDQHLSGDGRFTHMASKRLSELAGGRSVVLTTSCTHALEMTALLLDLGPGDEVIMPSFTFVSTANAYVLRGATPVFVDIRPDTLNLDESLVEEAITAHTRAIMVVHYGGIAAEMDTLLEIADRRALVVVEDNAHGLGATYRGRALGGIGSMGAQSFHATKNVVSGEGGALVLRDHSLLARAEIVREKGTNRTQFRRGTIDKYTWVDRGSSYLPSDILAALLYSQLERFDDIQARRHHVWTTYADALSDWAAMSEVRLPVVPDHVSHSAHLFYLLMPAASHQSGLIGHLARNRIRATSHYRPLHSSPFGSREGRSLGDCSVTAQVADTIVRLPLYPDLTDSEVERVVSAVTAYRT